MHRAYSGIVLVLLALFMVGCNDKDGGKVAAIIADTPVRSVALVEAEKPVRRDISQYLAETGRIEAENQVEVLAKGTGHCLTLNVEEGDWVKKDEVLAELDQAEMEAQVRQSRVNVAQQKMTFERAEGMMREGIGSPADRDNAKFSYEQAKASLEMQEVQLTYLKIRAPINGVVTRRSLQQGMLVTSGVSVFTIVDPASYVLPINVNERNLPRLRVGQQAYVTIDSAGDREFEATVRRINPGVDLQSSAIKVILDFKAEDHKYLREAAFARYRLVMDTRADALAVPKDAIIEDNTRRYVMVVTEEAAPVAEADVDPSGEAKLESEGDSTVKVKAAPENATQWIATRMEVETGLEDSDYTEIVRGISEDDMVITLGQQTVNDGDAVQIATIESALNAKTELSAEAALEAAKNRAPEDDAVRRKDGPPHRM